MSVFEIKRNDTLPVLDITLTDTDNNAVDLSGAQGVKLYVRDKKTDVEIINVPMTPDPDQVTHKGRVTYDWAPNDTALAGNYNGEVEVTFAANKIQTFPTEGYILIKIIKDLGP